MNKEIYIVPLETGRHLHTDERKHSAPLENKHAITHRHAHKHARK